MSRGPDAGTLLVRAVEADDSPALERWLTALPQAGLAMRGHLLAELVVRGISRADRMATIALEALTVEE